jgi:hypothetical protein
MAGDEAPGKKEFMIVVIAVIILLILSAVAHFEFKIL